MPAEAFDSIRKALPAFAAEFVPLAEASGRILRQEILAERDQPPFDRVMMDGIAVRHAALNLGTRRFRVHATQHAGDPRQALPGDDSCIEIMTGAVLPENADCIIPVERIAVAGGFATVEEGYVAARHQFIHVQGSDHVKGKTLLRPGTALTAMDIAIIASCGLPEISVSRMPSIRVISTGNELVPAGSAILPHQVRLSNGPALVAMLAQQGFRDCEQELLADDPSLLRGRLAQHLDDADVLILSGGVSMGKADFVPKVLEELSVRQVFHRISQQPGKPMWFGTGPKGQAVFALPGNPVSTLVCCRHYVLPALFEASGRAAGPARFAELGEDVSYEPALTRFLPVKLAGRDNGAVIALPVPPNTSGDFTSLSGTAGYVELCQEQSRFPAGTAVPLHLWDRP